MQLPTLTCPLFNDVCAEVLAQNREELVIDEISNLVVTVGRWQLACTVDDSEELVRLDHPIIASIT
ncbi:MAG TPA: hypothetical protein VMW65_13435 [Chloroflexota bacterium]|nr:hypothetical protein [Chloroflexota bacterium]